MSSAQLTEAKKEILRLELTKHVNNLRDSLGLSPLGPDSYLKKAAETHSAYMAKTRVLSHVEKGAGKTVLKRVKKAGTKDFQLVGENILFTSVDDLSMNKKKLTALAKSMFVQWKNSPGHYANMTNAEYVMGDFGFKEDPRKKTVYATQVFGTKGVRIDGQISKNAHGVRAGNDECDKLLMQLDNVVSNIGNDIEIENDTVKLYFHDIGLFKRIVTGPKDGLAIDIVRKSQFECMAPNQLDMSKIYDGVMLEPKYRNELLNGNEAMSEYRLITSLGVIPEDFRDDDIALSVIIIKNGYRCRYLVPAFVPRAQYELAKFVPALVNPNVKMDQEGIVNSEVLEYNFKTNITTAISIPKPKYPKSKVHSVRIISYSSIEGDSLKNISLHKNRGKYIKGKLSSQLNLRGVNVQYNASENWPKMKFQLGYLMADSLLSWPNQDLRDLVVSSDTSQNWDSLLFDQRSSRAVINYYGQLSQDASKQEIGMMNLRTAISINDMDKANKAMHNLWQSGIDDPSFLFEGEVFDAFMTRSELTQNASALLARYYDFDEFKSTEFISVWIHRSDELNSEAKANVLNLYSHTGYALLKNWDVQSKRLSNVIHPRKVETVVTDDQPAMNKLNAQLTFLQYYGHVIDHEGINDAFNYIREVAESETLEQDDVMDLVLFFNYWSQYKLTNDMLLKMFKDGSISDENVYILGHTLTQSSKKDEAYVDVMKKAAEIDQERWCEWMDIEFQIFRNHDVKRLYCETCK